MDLSEKDIECVVAKIFDNFNQTEEKISTNLVMKLVATYIARERTEFDVLKRLIDAHSVDEEISKHEMKLAFVQWADDFKNERDTNLIDNFTNEENVKIQDQYLSTSTCSVTSQEYREHIENLQDELINKDHLIIKLKNDIDLLSQQTHQNEEIQNLLIKERDSLKKKLHSEYIHSSELDRFKLEYNEITESLNILNNKSIVLERKLKRCKKENTLLNESVTKLEEEKAKLNQQLLKMEHDKADVLKMYHKAEDNIQFLRMECIKLSDKIVEQEVNIQNLVLIKNGLEADLKNKINKTHTDQSITNTSYENALVPKITYFDESIEPTLDFEDMSPNNIVSSTPRNKTSLMQEINQSCMIFCPKSDVNLIQPLYNTVTITSANVYGDLVSKSNHERFLFDKDNYISNDDIGQTQILSESNISNLSDSFLSNQLIEQCRLCTEFKKELHKNEHETKILKSNIDNLNNCLSNVKKYCSLYDSYWQYLNNSLNDASIRIKVLQCHIKQQTLSLNNKYNFDREFEKCESIGNSIVLSKLKTPGNIVNRRMKNNCFHMTSIKRKITVSNMFQNLYAYFAMFCFMIACLKMYVVTKYCSLLRRGIDVEFATWDFVSWDTFSFAFELRYDEPPPF